MVFCGIFPAGDSRIEELRDALEKLRLNDASFQYEPENSPALGLGFRAGFLGLLHREIVQERLERDFGLTLITTAPSVSYRVTRPERARRSRSTIPPSCPSRTEIATIEEPIIEAVILTPGPVSRRHPQAPRGPPRRAEEDGIHQRRSASS